MALDVGVVSAHAMMHREHAMEERLGAAEAYARRKCGREEVERRCRENGVVFQPMIFESAGGVSNEAEQVIRCLNRAVAEQTDTPYGEVAQRFWHRISIDIQRAGHRAFARRLGERQGAGGDGMEWLVDGVIGLDEGR